MEIEKVYNSKDFSSEYIDKLNEVIVSSKESIVAVTGKKGSGKEKFLAEIKNLVNKDFKKNSTNSKQCVSIDNVNTDNLINKVIDNIFPDSLSKNENNDKKSNKSIKNIKSITNFPSYDENKQKKFKKDIDTVTNKITNSDYNKLQRKYTIISLVASVLASLGSSIFILGCTNLRYLLPSKGQLLTGADWAQTLGLMLPGIVFILTSWLLFYLYYKNYKIEKNMPMNLEDQSRILLKLINNLNHRENDLKKLTIGIAKMLDMRSYFHFKSAFLSKKKRILCISTIFIIDNFGVLNTSEQMDLLKAMSILNQSDYIYFIVFLDLDDLKRIGDEQSRLLNKYIGKFVEIKYDSETAYKMLENWLNSYLLPNNDSGLWFKLANKFTKQKIYKDITDIFYSFVKEANSYDVIKEFVDDLNIYFEKLNKYVKYINPIEIVILYVLKHTRSNIYSYILSNPVSAFQISINLQKFDNIKILNDLSSSSSEQDKFIFSLVTENKYLQSIKVFTYLFTNVILQDMNKRKSISKFYHKFYSVTDNFVVFNNVDYFMQAISNFINQINNSDLQKAEDVFNLLFNNSDYLLINSSRVFDTEITSKVSSSQLFNFVLNKLMNFLTPSEYQLFLKYPFKKIYDDNCYIYALIKMFAMAIILDENILINMIDNFNKLDLVKMDSENLNDSFFARLKENPSLFYLIYLFKNTNSFDPNFFNYNFKFNYIEQKHIVIYNMLISNKFYDSLIYYIKQTDINFMQQNVWEKYGYIWLRYYLLNTNKSIEYSILNKSGEHIIDYALIMIFLNYSNYVLTPDIIPFKNVSVVNSFNKELVLKILRDNSNDIFNFQLVGNIINFKIGEIYYQYDLSLNQCNHIYTSDLSESYGSFNL